MPGLTDEEEERREPQPHVRAKIDEIANLIRKDGKIDKAEAAGAKSRTDLSNIYQSIEKDLHGNRAAVKQVRKLLTGTTDAAYDFMRTFIPLARAFDLDPFEGDNGDMLDKADRQGNGGGEGVIPLRSSPLDRARDHLEGGTKPEPSDKEKRQAEYGFDENPPPGKPGDKDLDEAGDAARQATEGTKPSGGKVSRARQQTNEGVPLH